MFINKTRKRFPGCIYSFNGFPVTGIEDVTGLTYIACITYKMKNKNEPWDGIYKLKEQTIISNTKKLLILINKMKLNKKLLKNNNILTLKLNLIFQIT